MKSAMSDGQLVRPDLLALMAPLSRTSSWAVWGSARPVGPFSSASDISFPAADPDVAGLLHGRAVVVALNPGGAAAEWSDSHAWKNFHAGPRHNDHLLAEAFRDTPVWGGYLTDLHPTIVESDSGLVRPRRELVTSAVASLVDQIEMLGDPDPLVICVGKVAWSGVTDNLALLREAWGSADPNVVGIPHYSGANNGVHGGDPRRYRAIVAELLDGPLRRLRR